jgi:hypothetical protein
MIDLDNLMSIDLDKLMLVDIEKLQAGEAVIYAECRSLGRLRVKHPTDPQVAAADAAWRLALAGRVDLMQRRVGDKFQYIAVKRWTVDRQPVQPVLPSQAVRCAA